MNNVYLCKTITEKHIQHFVHLIELHGRKVLYIKFLQTIVKAEKLSRYCYVRSMNQN